MRRVFFFLGIQLLITSAMNPVFSQDASKSEGYVFKEVKRLPATSVKDQFRSGTCWSFAATSFIESELLRMGKGEYDLSEMFSVYYSYYEKAIKYARLHGNASVGSGGEGHDVINVLAKYGMLPEEIYSGKNMGQDKHVHGEMDEVIKAYMDAVIENPNRELTTSWAGGLEGILKAYLGEIPAEFSYKGKSYNPKSFAASLGINLDDYISIGSYTHHPFYSRFIIEIPDNWAWGSIYNVPLEDLSRIANNAIDKGYTVAWAADVSEKGFSWSKGVAIVPEILPQDLSGTEQSRWESLTEREKNEMMYKFDKPGREKQITQELRQKAFDSYLTTDDHLMHIVGKATDQNGKPYFIVKNSWEPKGHIYNGYLYSSEPYFQYKTIFIMIHKNALPDDIAAKLGVKK